jgi:hypothetical protein
MKNKELKLRQIIRHILFEELGRNKFTTNNDPVNFKEFAELEVNVDFVSAMKKWTVTIKDRRTKKKLSYKTFVDESEATNWAQIQTSNFRNLIMNNDSDYSTNNWLA